MPGLTNCTVSDLIELDKHFVHRIDQRKRIMRDHFDAVIGANERVSKQAVDELYVWIVSKYLPSRFPTVYSIGKDPVTSQQGLYCRPTKEWHSLKPKLAVVKTLQALGSIVEEDFQILLTDHDGDYVPRAFINCFPNSFDPASILNVKLRDIHKPVPGYKEKLEFSMDRYFSRIEVGKFTSRVNVSPFQRCRSLSSVACLANAAFSKWAVTPYDELFTPKGHRLTGGTREEAHAVDLDPDKV